MAKLTKKSRSIVVIIILAIAGFFAYKKWGPKIDSNGDRWSVGAGNVIFRNGVATAGITDDTRQLWIQGGVAYTVGKDGATYKWTGSSFTSNLSA